MAYWNDLRWINITELCLGSENDNQNNTKLIEYTSSFWQIPKAAFLVLDILYQGAFWEKTQEKLDSMQFFTLKYYTGN